MGVGSPARAGGVPLRPPVPSQRHDCPRLGRRRAGLAAARWMRLGLATSVPLPVRKSSAAPPPLS
ncbi:hypothetical protein EAO75_11980 [Streptomyces sp. uw30]|nr:hypothetical protein EAO75_11980 [Streptomyces sp. uw30]